MLPDRECVVCKEEAALFCRLCSTHYCHDHMCLHLSVAWEGNTWTKRNNQPPEGRLVLEPEPTASPTAKVLASFSEAELQEQLEFFTAQVRRIRKELERRNLFEFSRARCAERPPRAYARARRTDKIIAKLITAVLAGRIGLATIEEYLTNSIPKSKDG